MNVHCVRTLCKHLFIAKHTCKLFLLQGYQELSGSQLLPAATRLRRLTFCRHKCERLQHPQNFKHWVDRSMEAHGLRRSSPHRLANLPVTNERYQIHADNAPNHASASTREFIRLNKPKNEELLAVPPSSPGLNMCDYYLRKAIQDRLQPRSGARVWSSARTLRQAYNSPLDEIRRSICS